VNISIPVSPGDLLDRITILEIKLERIEVADRRAHVAHELDLLRQAASQAGLPRAALRPLIAALAAVNRELWQVEDSIRDRERQRDFGPDFIALARSVYRKNDERARLKRAINEACGSELREEKLYQPYAQADPAVG
jgi:hypothetical protein